MAQESMKSQSEQEIQFKKRARRRLVGAVALVILMILLLPMMLEDRFAQTPKKEIDISIISQDNQLEAKLDAGPEVAQSDTPLPITETSSAPSPLAAPVQEIKPPEVKPTEPSVSQEVKTSPKEESKSRLESAIPVGYFYVQIGVLSNPYKVQQLQAKLSENGLNSSAELIDTVKGKKTRLRVGTFLSRSDAETALVKVKALGLTDAIVGN